MRQTALLLLLVLLSAGCSVVVEGESTPGPAAEKADWALVIHGGAGTIPVDRPEAERRAYAASLGAALEVGSGILADGGTALQAVEATIRLLEDDPLFNAGRGAVFNRAGGHELDASLMDGSTLACGAVAGVRTVRNPITLARLVMERSGHVLLAGEGAEQFAAAQGIEPVDQAYFFTEKRKRALEKKLAVESENEEGGGTVGAVALDRDGNLAAGTSTGGLTGKRYGRVGDSPIVGAGTYAKNGVCGVSGTGRGEEFIRHGVARSIAWLVEVGGMGVAEAARSVVHDQLQPGDGGVIVLGADGRIAMEFNTTGMYRGAVDSSGRFEVAIH
jgi:beta-aspartyl-peptidase (threonine type)